MKECLWRNRIKKQKINKKIGWKQQILNLIYPPRCPICHEIVAPGYKMVCGSCVAKIPFVGEIRCQKCGKPVEAGMQYCMDCESGDHDYDQGIGIFLYDDVMRKSISYFKYMGRQEYGAFYAMAAWKYGKCMLDEWKPQVLIPVPIHISRRIKRGYNQAELIAKALGDRMKIPVAADAVVRTEKTVAQKELSAEERKENLLHAFKAGPYPFCWERVLVIDDIYTTGSTADAVSKILRARGAKEIYVLSICIGKGFMVQ